MASSVHSKEAMRHAMFTLWSLGKSAKEIHADLSHIHGSAAPSVRTVFNWVDQFRTGKKDVEDQKRSGRPKTPNTRRLTKVIDDMVKEDGRLTIREICDRTGGTVGTVSRILHDELDLTKLSARWIPRVLTENMKQDREIMSIDNLDMVEDNGGWERVRSLIVTGDETWVPFFDPPTKEESRVWTKKGSDPPLKARRDAHTKKVMLTLFFDSNGPLTIDFLAQGQTINADRYVATLKQLKKDISNKRRGTIQPNLLLHDNARPHTAHKAKEAIERLKLDTLPHPPYSPDLSPCDFALFPTMKRLLRGRVFASRENLESEVRKVLLYEIPKEEYAKAIDALPIRWTKCTRLSGDYVEKVSLTADDGDCDS